MRNTGSIFLFFIIFLNIGSCNNDTPKPNLSIITGNWKILSASLQNTPEESPGNNFLFFSEEHTYELVLDKSVDVNICGNNFDLVSDDIISFSPPICTKICCDSDFAMKLIRIITEMGSNTTNYVIRNDSLILISTGMLTLQKIP
jgi:hypothetical protein